MDFAILILQTIKKVKGKTVCLTEKTYDLICPTLPQEKQVLSRTGITTFVHVDKQKLIDHIKEKYRLFDVSRDIQKIKESIYNNS